MHVLVQILVAGLRHTTVVTDDPSVLSVLEIKKNEFLVHWKEEGKATLFICTSGNI